MHTRVQQSMLGRVQGVWQSLIERDCLLDIYQLKRLAEHRYSAQSTSYLDELCMNECVFMTCIELHCCRFAVSGIVWSTTIHYGWRRILSLCWVWL
jgi:hypothetical protein